MSSVSTGRSLLHTITRCDAEGVCLWGKRFEWQNAARPDFEVIDLGLVEGLSGAPSTLRNSVGSDDSSEAEESDSIE